MDKEYIDLLDRFSGKRVVVVGDLMLDRYISGLVERISPEAPVPVVRVQAEQERPGGAANVACLLAALGSQVTLCGVVGEDQAGQQLLALLDQDNIDTSYIKKVVGITTTVKTRVVSSKQQLLRIDHEPCGPLQSCVVGQVASDVGQLVPEVDAVIISDYGKGLVLPGLIEKVAQAGAQYRKIVAVDPKVEHFFQYKNVTVITPNNAEASAAVGFAIHDSATLRAACAKIQDQLAPEFLLITRSEHGIALFEQDGSLQEVPAQVREVYDVTGAGDMVIAVFTLALSSGGTGKVAAELANLAAGLEVSHFGCQTVSLEELKGAAQDG